MLIVPPKIVLFTIRANGTEAAGTFPVAVSPTMLIPPPRFPTSSLLTTTAPGNRRWLLRVTVFRTAPGLGALETASRASARNVIPNPEEFEIRVFSTTTCPCSRTVLRSPSRSNDRATPIEAGIVTVTVPTIDISSLSWPTTLPLTETAAIDIRL